MKTLQLLASVFLGWSLGANNAANVFGTAVSSQMVRWRTAAALIAVAVVIGALLQGAPGLETYRSIVAGQNLKTAFLAALAAACTAAFMTWLALPVSTSQAIVGAMIGIALLDQQPINLASLEKVAICWVGTPFGAALMALVLYPALASLVRRARLHFLVYDRLMRALLILAGVWGAYALGANNVANATGVFYAAGAFQNGLCHERTIALLMGGASIALGALTYSRKVMMTVGQEIIPLDAFSAFVVVVSQAATVYIYALVGVPVSTSQAIVGAVVGIGVLKGMRTVSRSALLRIGLGWLATPVLGGGIAALLRFVF